MATPSFSSLNVSTPLILKKFISRSKETQSSFCPVHSTKCPLTPELCRAKVKSQETHPKSPGTQVLSILCCLPGRVLIGSWNLEQNLDLNPGFPTWDVSMQISAWTAKSNPCCTPPLPTPHPRNLTLKHSPCQDACPHPRELGGGSARLGSGVKSCA